MSTKEATGYATATPVQTTVQTTTAQPQYQQQMPTETSGMAIAALVCGIIGLFFFGIILGPVAICLGLSAKNKIREDPQRYTGQCQATAGIVLGIIDVIGSIIFIIIIVGNNEV